ncbi:hypothetical protein [Roseomonas elaeocarpi]|uniref:Uncharacterized protein n=1 Tax=Roseomonas elaeocarpi TaxID=907779 RepID=A0ABV6K0A4_9PROT
MSFWIDPALGVAGAGGLMLGWLVRSRRSAERRTRDLRDAAAYLQDHYTALEMVLRNNQVSSEIKNFVVELSDMLEEERLAKELLIHWSTDPETSPRPGSNGMFVEQLLNLAVEDPAAYADVMQCVSAGLLGATLRWPETAPYFQAVAARLATQPRADVAVVRLVAGNRGFDRSFGAMPAAA